MLSHSYTLIILAIAYIIAIVGYNQTGMMVTSFSTAIHRNIYEALRSIAVWVLSAVVYYLFPNSGGGEPLNIMSLIQLLGFAISILGSFIYNRVIKFPCYNYENENENQQAISQQESTNEYEKI